MDAIVVNAAGCGSAMKEYAELLAGDGGWGRAGGRAVAPGSATSPSSSPSSARPPRRHPLPVTVAYHDACHLGHAQRVPAQPRALLRGDPRACC